ncbi:MAG: hypothetical protein ACI9TI_000398 [Natronomonas sp.]|jgi:hypothetical protein|uniref:hypothetical protein n=1 Tax=Natronomonas sp. TaxID=2184060 RepID=UPI0039892B93
MVEILELVGGIGFGLAIGAFFGFVLSRGDLVMAGIGAVAFTVITLIYTFTLGQTGGLDAVEPRSH